jgi:hypothetical protein
MAKVIHDLKDLPERTLRTPGAKPPVNSLPYVDLGHPEEVDEFLELLRKIRQREPACPK